MVSLLNAKEDMKIRTWPSSTRMAGLGSFQAAALANIEVHLRRCPHIAMARKVTKRKLIEVVQSVCSKYLTPMKKPILKSKRCGWSLMLWLDPLIIYLRRTRLSAPSTRIARHMTKLSFRIRTFSSKNLLRTPRVRVEGIVPAL